MCDSYSSGTRRRQAPLPDADFSPPGYTRHCMRSWCTITSVRDVVRSLHAHARRRALFTTFTFLGFLALPGKPASAQSGTVGGVVVASGTQEPIPGARVDV